MHMTRSFQQLMADIKICSKLFGNIYIRLFALYICISFRLFKCPKERGLFVLAKYCKQDRRFSLNESAANATPEEIDSPNDFGEGKSMLLNEVNATFGNIDCPIIHGAVAPISKHLYIITS